jgi:uncharacterized membrane protein (UPF0127 family)
VTEGVEKDRSSNPVARLLERLPGSRALQLAVVVLLVAGATAFLLKGGSEPADPFLQEPRRVRIAGFGEIGFTVDRMAAAERCALLAQDDQQRSRGLMNQMSLSGYDGMLFVFEADSRGAFYMKDTPLPLSIAWFDAGGRFVSATDMEPCLASPECPLYSPAGPYRYALEVPKGGLEALGIGPGSTITVGGPCPA